MKSIKFIATAMIAVSASAFVFAGTYDQSKSASTKAETIKVSGKCEMCKARIEKAAKVNGVSKADWNQDTRILSLVYNPSVVTSDEVQKRIAVAGHDTEKFRATDAAYKSLPSCCHYERTGTDSRGVSQSGK